MSSAGHPARAVPPTAAVDILTEPHARLQSLAPSQTVPWTDGWVVGAGIDVVTGRHTANPFESVEPEPVTPNHSFSDEERLLLIEDHSARSYENLVSAVAMADVLNLPPVDFRLGAGASWTRSISASSTHATYVVWYRSLSAVRQVDVRNFRLRQSAKDLALTQPALFRERYGDYFVEQVLVGWSFMAIVTVHARRSSSMQAALSFLKANATAKIDASLAVKVDQELAAQSITIDVSIRASGVEGTDTSDQDPRPSTTEAHNFRDILASLEWHKRHARPSPLGAHIRHYSFLEDLEGLPLRLPLPKHAFDEIRDIRRLVFSCRTLCDVISPSVYDSDKLPALAKLRVRVEHLISDCVNDQAELPYSSGARAKRLGELHELMSNISKTVRIFSIFEQVAAHGKQEPIDRTAEHREVWSYGLTTLHSTEEVTITEGSKLEVVVHPLDKHTQCLVVEDGQHVVGWQIYAPSHHGTWRRQSPIILGRKPAISFAGRASALFSLSKCTFTITLFVVKNNPTFDMLYDHSQKANEMYFNSNDAERLRKQKAQQNPLDVI